MSIDLQLVKVFRDTLASLPASARSKIESFWRSQGVQEHDGFLIPPVLKESNLGANSTCASTDGVIFKFKSTFADQAPDQILKIGIAHELAHAYRAAELGMPLNDASAYGLVSHGAEEDAANRLMTEWGFERCALLQWLEQNAEKLRL